MLVGPRRRRRRRARWFEAVTCTRPWNWTRGWLGVGQSSGVADSRRARIEESRTKVWRSEEAAEAEEGEELTDGGPRATVARVNAAVCRVFIIIRGPIYGISYDNLMIILRQCQSYDRLTTGV